MVVVLTYPLGQFRPGNSVSMFFFFNLSRFFVTVTIFCARAARMLIRRGIVLI